MRRLAIPARNSAAAPASSGRFLRSKGGPPFPPGPYGRNRCFRTVEGRTRERGQKRSYGVRRDHVTKSDLVSGDPAKPDCDNSRSLFRMC